MLDALALPPLDHLVDATFRDALGLAPPGRTERGERRRCRLDLALGYCDGAQVEDLGPGRGIDAIEGRLNAAGYPTVVAGGVRLGWLGAFEFKYFDTRDALGIYLEILEFRAFGRRPIELRARCEARGARDRTLR